jgi:phosphatidylserine/phosphatidylglycerophosphate/cardiolipin synthase-like enzyme
LRQSRTLRSKDIEISFLPRLLPHPLFHFLDRLDPDAQIKIAASHLKGWAVNKLLKLAARGCRIEIVAESTERRVPKRFEKQLKAAGIRIRRAGLGWQMPMHDKFTLVYWHGMKYSFFGSFNWTTGSMRRNLEVVASSTNPRLHDILEDRWNELSAYS